MTITGNGFRGVMEDALAMYDAGHQMNAAAYFLSAFAKRSFRPEISRSPFTHICVMFSAQLGDRDSFEQSMASLIEGEPATDEAPVTQLDNDWWDPALSDDLELGPSPCGDCGECTDCLASHYQDLGGPN